MSGRSGWPCHGLPGSTPSWAFHSALVLCTLASEKVTHGTFAFRGNLICGCLERRAKLQPSSATRPLHTTLLMKTWLLVVSMQEPPSSTQTSMLSCGHPSPSASATTRKRRTFATSKVELDTTRWCSSTPMASAWCASRRPIHCAHRGLHGLSRFGFEENWPARSPRARKKSERLGW